MQSNENLDKKINFKNQDFSEHIGAENLSNAQGINPQFTNNRFFFKSIIFIKKKT